MEQKKYVMDHCQELAELLDIEYGSPHHNNKKDPLDELIFILLSRRTRGVGYESTYNELKSKYGTWEKVATAPKKDVLKIIEKAGLGPKRVDEIQENLREINKKFGKYSLDRLHRLNKKLLFDYLASLRGVGPKSAYCIMMYSLGKDVFPVDTHVNRICQRLGIIEEGLDHKKGQELLAEMFPKRLRYSLHVNMLSHGRKVCLTRKPKCDICIISGFCAYPRKQAECPKPNRFIDLFAGAGGMSLGFENAGFSLYAAIEKNAKASSTFLYNRPYLNAKSVYNVDIRLPFNPNRFKRKGVKLIVAGPPCQDFSGAKQNHLKKQHGKELYKEVLRFVKFIKPKFVVIENVPGMAHKVNEEYVKRVENGLRRSGYEVKSGFINANRYRIPQRRNRLFFIARRVYNGRKHSAMEAVERVWDKIRSAESKENISFREGVSGLPSLFPGEGADILQKGNRGRVSTYATDMGYNGGPIFNHIARKHNSRDLEAYALMKEGDDAIDLYSKRPDLMTYSIGNFHTKYFKIINDEPSPTIPAHLRKDANSFIHPRDNRGITPREAARLQSFPDSYRFLGSFGLQFEQIGNAVPPRLAEVIGRAIMTEIHEAKGGKQNG